MVASRPFTPPLAPEPDGGIERRTGAIVIERKDTDVTIGNDEAEFSNDNGVHRIKGFLSKIVLLNDGSFRAVFLFRNGGMMIVKNPGAHFLNIGSTYVIKAWPSDEGYNISEVERVA